VQKVSNLILNMNIAVRDAGRFLADARANTQESRSRALDCLAANRFGPGAL
jgi:Protein of unknown function (DUF2380)